MAFIICSNFEFTKNTICNCGILGFKIIPMYFKKFKKKNGKKFAPLFEKSIIQ